MGPRRRSAVLAATAVGALAAGCGGPSAPAPTPAARHPSPAPIVDSASAPALRPVAPSGPRHAPVAILMYHVIAPAPPAAAYSDLWVGTGRFTRQLHALARAGYHATTLDSVWRAWHGHGSLPRHPIVISFDDGYQSQSTTARRKLDELGWPGVLNLEVKNVGLKGGLARNEVRAMLRDGWEIDAHTLTHPDLTTLAPAVLRREVAGSRRWLHRAFGVPVDFFAYPAGRYDPSVEAAVRAAGYRGATTTQPGQATRATDPYALPRIRVTPEMTPRQLVAAIHGLARS
ncbi:MAG TPA: polysaccharide deacetylase family protein [Solirubrobacteraceae bacterium]